MKDLTIPLIVAIILLAIITSIPFRVHSQTLVADETTMQIGKSIKIVTYNDFIFQCMQIDLKAKARCIKTVKVNGVKIKRYEVVLPLSGLEYINEFFNALNRR